MESCVFNITWYRVTWSGKFTLVQEKCSLCNKIRERSIRCDLASSYPSKKWHKNNRLLIIKDE